MCEEFHCLPSQAIEELEAAPLNLALDIITLRSYAETKRQLDNAKSEDDVPASPMLDMVFEIQAELLKEKRGRPEYHSESDR